EGWLQSFQTLLQSMVADLDRPLGQLELLSESQRRQIARFSAARAQYPPQRCIHELFEIQARRSPGSTAVAHEGCSLSYAELNDQSNRLAHYLIEHGVVPDSRVGICVERGLPMVVGLLAILKAGGAYVPLDPRYPRERLRYLLSDSQPVLLLTDAAGKDALFDDDLSVPMIELEADAHGWSHHSCENPRAGSPGLPPESLAYVIYTS